MKEPKISHVAQVLQTQAGLAPADYLSMSVDSRKRIETALTNHMDALASENINFANTRQKLIEVVEAERARNTT
jgi:hypothetical protein